MERRPFSKVKMGHKYKCEMENYKTPLTHRRNPHGLMIKTTFVDGRPKVLCMIEVAEKLDLIKIKTNKQKTWASLGNSAVVWTAQSLTVARNKLKCQKSRNVFHITSNKNSKAKNKAKPVTTHLKKINVMKDEKVNRMNRTFVNIQKELANLKKSFS